jgi:hypothetical protein
MQKRIYVVILGLFLAFAVFGTANAFRNTGDGPGGGGEATTCARCTGAKACEGGYPSGGSECASQCKWESKTKGWTNCSCWTIGDCPSRGGGGSGTVIQ